MDIYKGLVNDINIIFEKINIDSIKYLESAKEFRKLSSMLDRVYSMLISTYDGDDDTFKNILNNISSSLDDKISEIESIKTSLLKMGKYDNYYDIMIGYEKLLSMKRDVLTNIKYIKQRKNIIERKNNHSRSKK